MWRMISSNGSGSLKEVQASKNFSRLDAIERLYLDMLNECRLCGWRCSISRYKGSGKCGLGSVGMYSKPFIHIAEEDQINPSIVTNFGGCAMQCVYCIAPDDLVCKNMDKVEPKSYWSRVGELSRSNVPVNSIEFTNPTESFPSMVGLLNNAPEDIRFPLVLNCHLYGSREFYELGNMLADVWLPDLRYGDDRCAMELSGVPDYMRIAKIGLDEITKSDAKVIVRILVLPGHVSCCHEPAFRMLADYKEKIFVSVLEQYVPEHNAKNFSRISKRPAQSEIDAVKGMIKRYGLRDVSDEKYFWLR